MVYDGGSALRKSFALSKPVGPCPNMGIRKWFAAPRNVTTPKFSQGSRPCCSGGKPTRFCGGVP